MNLNVKNNWQRAPRFERRLACITGLGFILRIAFTLAVMDIPFVGNNDQEGYVIRGLDWGAGNFQGDFLRTPGYPGLIAITEWTQRLFGLELPLRLRMGAVQTILACVSIWLIGRIGHRLFGSPSAGLFAAGALALWPNQILHSAGIMSEGLATPLLVCALAALFLPKTLEVRHIAASAVFSGLMVLTRPQLTLTVLVLGSLVYALTKSHQAKKYWGLRCAITFIGITFLVQLPWLGIIWHDTGRPYLQTSTAVAFNLCMGNNPSATGTWSDEVFKTYCPAIPNTQDEFEVSQAMQNGALDWIFENPGRQPALIRERVGQLFHSDAYGTTLYPSSNNYHGPIPLFGWFVITFFWWWSAVLLTLTGLLIGWKRCRTDTLWLSAVAVSTIATSFITIGDPRFHDALVPIMALFIGVSLAGIARAKNRLRAKKTRQSAAFRTISQ